VNSSIKILLLSNLIIARNLAMITMLLLTGFCMSPSVRAAHGIDPALVECGSPASGNVITSNSLTVLTLNLAHGRKSALNQMLQKTSTTRSNLEEIADFLRSSGADLIALQEADAPSRWSGKFNHVDFVAERAPYPCRIHAHHAHKGMYDFGTALLSPVPYTEKLSHTFAPSPPTTNKGFVMGKVLWNPGGQLPEPITISIISVHLDFSRRKVRESQTREMQDMLPDIATPVIILGDFNTDWSQDESALRAIVANGKFKLFRPEATDLGTYKNGQQRLDWILISNDLEFVSYSVPSIVLSDHQPVIASLRLLEKPSTEMDSSNHD
jgi:endonuclease/exonuclease/phosphatase family metal-dependent hydrolase